MSFNLQLSKSENIKAMFSAPKWLPVCIQFRLPIAKWRNIRSAALLCISTRPSCKNTLKAFSSSSYIVDCSLNHCTIRRIKLDLLQQLHQLANDRCTVLKSKSASLLCSMLAYLRLSLYLEEVVHHQDDYTHTMVRDISIHKAMAGMERAACMHGWYQTLNISIHNMISVCTDVDSNSINVSRLIL